MLLIVYNKLYKFTNEKSLFWFTFEQNLAKILTNGSDFMLILIGASASGKTEIAKRLIESYGFTKMVTTTTRPKRINEKPGIDYHFVDKTQFLTLKTNHAFLETAEYSGHYYGTPKKGVKKNTVLIVEPSGANTIYHACKDQVIVCYINTPESIRAQRMKTRGDAMHSIAVRLKQDAQIFNPDKLNHIDFIIDNEDTDLDTLTHTIDALYRSHYSKLQQNDD